MARRGRLAELSTEVVHDRRRAEILRGEFDPREPISRSSWPSGSVSRTPLREALRMLQREGLIDSEPNRRVRVAGLSVTTWSSCMRPGSWSTRYGCGWSCPG